MNKTQVIKILGKGTLVVTTLLFGVVSFWPIVNSTNHTGYEPYYFIIPFIILAIISFAILIFTEEKNINATTILLSFVAILLLFTYKEFNIMLNYDEWLTRGMPNRFETVPTMFWADTKESDSWYIIEIDDYCEEIGVIDFETIYDNHRYIYNCLNEEFPSLKSIRTEDLSTIYISLEGQASEKDLNELQNSKISNYLDNPKYCKAKDDCVPSLVSRDDRNSNVTIINKYWNSIPPEELDVSDIRKISNNEWIPEFDCIQNQCTIQE